VRLAERAVVRGLVRAALEPDEDFARGVGGCRRRGGPRARGDDEKKPGYGRSENERTDTDTGDLRHRGTTSKHRAAGNITAYGGR
jgi:hypothetical protein